MASKRASRWYIALIVVLTLYATYRCTLHLMVKAKLDEIRRQGYPVTLAELDKWYAQPPPGENATDVYTSAFAHFSLFKLGPDDVRSKSENIQYRLVPYAGKGKAPHDNDPLSEDVKMAISAYLNSNDTAVTLLMKAVAIKNCVFPLNSSEGEEMKVPHIWKVKDAAHLLQLRAILCAETNDADSAERSLLALVDLANSLTNELLCIDQTRQIDCLFMAKESLQRMLNRIALTDTQLTRLAPICDVGQSLHTLHRMLLGQRCFGIVVFDKLRRDSWREAQGDNGYVGGDLNGYDPPVRSLIVYRALGWLDLDFLHYLDRYAELVQTARSDFFTGRGLVRKPYYSDTIRKDCMVAWYQLCGFEQLQIRQVQSIALTRVIRTVLALERYRTSRGTLPDNLTDLCPVFLESVPEDPYDSRPLRYKKLPEGYVVYSIGGDCVDNGGTQTDKYDREYMPGTDITFTVER